LKVQLGGPQYQVVALSIDQDGPAAVREFFYTEIDVPRLGLYLDDTGDALTPLKVPEYSDGIISRPQRQGAGV
jgi:hypothetical protein